MKILALDLGSKLGYASGINDKVTAHGVKFLVKGKWFSHESFWDFTQWIFAMAKQVDVIVVEKPNSHMPGYQGVVIHFGMYGIVSAACGKLSKPLIPISANTIKKQWTGDGHARKDAMVAQTKANGYKDVSDDNESDAIALYHTYLHLLKAGAINGTEEDLSE
jgi:Holliday junction resolvasome RuvABC endonuclease subunit